MIKLKKLTQKVLTRFYNGLKIKFSNHFFIVIYGWQIFYVYKRFPASVVRIKGIEC